MYRNDETAELRRQLREQQEERASLKSALAEYRQTIRSLHSRLEKYERKNGVGSWLKEKVATIFDWIRWNAKGILIVVGVLIGAALLTFLVIAAAEHTKRARYAGEIVEKTYHPPYTSTSRVCTSDARGHQTCTNHTTHHPARWTVDLLYGEHIHNYEISHSLYEQIEEKHWLCLPQATLQDCDHGRGTFVYH
jgi:hypothetical protein